MVPATNDVDRVVFAAGEGCYAGGFTGNGLRCVDYDVYAVIHWQLTLFCPVADASDGDHDQRNGDALHERFKLAQAAFSSLNDRTQESLTQYPA